MKLKLPLGIVGVLLTIVSVGIYLLATVDINTVKGAIQIENPRCYIDNGLLTRTHYMQYEVVPTDKTKPDAIYRIEMDTRAVDQVDKVYWSEVELDIKKPKLITHKISYDEYVSLGVYPSFDVKVTEVRAEKDGSFLMLPVAFLGLVTLFVMSGVTKPRLPKETRRYRYREEVADIKLSDEEQALKCVKCECIKMVNSVLKCSKEKCKYE